MSLSNTFQPHSAPSDLGMSGAPGELKIQETLFPGLFPGILSASDVVGLYGVFYFFVSGFSTFNDTLGHIW